MAFICNKEFSHCAASTFSFSFLFSFPHIYRFCRSSYSVHLHTLSHIHKQRSVSCNGLWEKEASTWSNVYAVWLCILPLPLPLSSKCLHHPWYMAGVVWLLLVHPTVIFISLFCSVCRSWFPSTFFHIHCYITTTHTHTHTAYSSFYTLSYSHFHLYSSVLFCFSSFSLCFYSGL